MEEDLSQKTWPSRGISSPFIFKLQAGMLRHQPPQLENSTFAATMVILCVIGHFIMSDF
jgi:hypothetical protein